ncbi:antibiotic resistance protein VanZ [Bradyrhizobium sp. CCBAU 11386]|uniref:VanZ family protein n=1 Tax=Bradyrhizobium sp. CCBAU 11386 TaxID=1630837 RepID=UPI002FDF2156|nr:antibiotic resistance protein VanZ [Bradyrhizobium sp. CCBAU 11386]
MYRNHLIAAAGICLALIIYATLARLAGRPVLVGHHEAYWVVVIERFSAYGLLGFLLSFLLPGRFGLACGLVVAVAVGLEVLQGLTPDRDPSLLDVLQKGAGGTVGVLLAQTILAFLPRPPS